MKIKFKLFTAFVILSLIPLLVVTYMTHNDSLDLIKNKVLAEHQVDIEEEVSETLLLTEKYTSTILLVKDLPPIPGIIKKMTSAKRGFLQSEKMP